MVSFNTHQNFQARVINNSSFDRFIWVNHNFGTTYQEPYANTTIRSNANQSYVFKTTAKPIRYFELDFTTLIYTDDPNILANLPDKLNFAKLLDFYKKHGCSRKFIYNHPVYGDLFVRFGKPIVMPKKNIGSVGSVQSFTISLFEVVDTDYLMSQDEDITGDLAFPCTMFDVEFEYKEDVLIAPLGDNYNMVFTDTKKPLRNIKVYIEGMSYFQNKDDTLSISYKPHINMLLLEYFYFKNRLSNTFNLEFAGETIPVRFSSPLTIPKPNINGLGVMPTVTLDLVEDKYTRYTRS